jgi:hypothetical protein
MAISMTVIPEIINIGLGIRSVRGSIRVPRPAAKIIALLGITQGTMGSLLINMINLDQTMQSPPL